MVRPLLIVALLLVPAAFTQAEDEVAMAEALVVNRAAVLGSPGVPKALDAFLPGGKRPQPLAWPLPKGSVVVLGLPHHDPLARRLCDVFQLDVDDLGGGYAIWAWRDGRDAKVFVMGADPAALQAARFEFEASAPAKMIAPDMRSLDFKRPNEEAFTVVRAGTRRVRPHHAIRAWAPGDFVRDEDATTAGGARANRVWIETRQEPHRGWRATVAALRTQGVTPVLALRTPWPLSAKDADVFARADALTASAWQRELGVQHVALVFERNTAARERAIARRITEALRPGGLEELIVVPSAYSDRLARALGPPPDLRDIPEALIAWSGPSEHATTVTREQAERRVREAGVPVVLLETWAAPSQRGKDKARIPSLPRGRDADLPDVLAGVVVVGRNTAPILESAWEPLEAHRFGTQLLQPLVPTTGTEDPEAFAADLMRRLRAADKENLGLVPWMAPMADALRDGVWNRGGRPSAAGIPIVPSSGSVDGRLDDRAWGFARGLVRYDRGVDVLTYSDGHALHVGIRIDRDVVGTVPYVLQLSLEAPGRSQRWHVRATPEGVTLDASGRPGAPALEPGHVRTARHVSKTHHTIEVVFDRFALGGEPHAGRLFDCGISWGPTSLWPAGPKNGVTGTLLVTR
ncbi:MAG: hypothetical protein QNJ90_03495 [Planctomycetota bacterium]|nr:hypothetical protein [Planctomycetota bacterium]